MKGKFYILGLLLVFMIMLAGCGGNTAAPPDATITINPSTISPFADTSSTQTEKFVPFTILVKYADGTLAKNTLINITSPLAAPNPGSLIRFLNGNTQFASGEAVLTDNNGTFLLSVGYQSGNGLKYNAVIQVTSGGATPVTATLTVT